MKETNLISIEIGRSCNLASIHTSCPSGDNDRYGDLDTTLPINNDQIVSLVSNAYMNMGFKGMVAFHYYNEPLLYPDKVSYIIDNVRKLVPHSKFFLNTNGYYIKDNVELVKKFSRITLSNYNNEDWSWLKEQLPSTCSLWVFNIRTLDSRKNNFKEYTEPILCNRSYKEIIIDYYGNAHLCCMDWKGNVNLGNIHYDSFEDIMIKFSDIRSKISSSPMHVDSPDICKRCRLKTPNKNV